LNGQRAGPGGSTAATRSAPPKALRTGTQLGLLLQQRDQVLPLCPKYRQMVATQSALMQVLERFAAKHHEAVDRGEAKTLTRKSLTSMQVPRRRGSTRLQPDVVPPSAVPGGRGALRSNRTPIMRITKHTAAAPNAGRVPS
jgi:hypothetical protein